MGQDQLHAASPGNIANALARDAEVINTELAELEKVLGLLGSSLLPMIWSR
jgi:hypothetical protein